MQRPEGIGGVRSAQVGEEGIAQEKLCVLCGLLQERDAGVGRLPARLKAQQFLEHLQHLQYRQRVSICTFAPGKQVN